MQIYLTWHYLVVTHLHTVGCHFLPFTYRKDHESNHPLLLPLLTLLLLPIVCRKEVQTRFNSLLCWKRWVGRWKTSSMLQMYFWYDYYPRNVYSSSKCVVQDACVLATLASCVSNQIPLRKSLFHLTSQLWWPNVAKFTLVATYTGFFKLEVQVFVGHLSQIWAHGFWIVQWNNNCTYDKVQNYNVSCLVMRIVVISLDNSKGVTCEDL